MCQFSFCFGRYVKRFDMFFILFLSMFTGATSLSKDISLSVFGDDREFIPAAFGDFNSDGLIDLFVTRNDSKVLDVLFANEKEPLFSKGAKMNCSFENFKITSVVPGDFDGDAFMDILITTQNISEKSSDLHDIRIIWGELGKANCTLRDVPVIIKMIGQPLAMDYNQDMIIDLFGLNLDEKRTFWVFQSNRSQYIEIPMNNTFRKMRIPHSHSFLDINGDFVSDLLVTSLSIFEVWLGNAEGSGFTFYKNYNLPIGSLQSRIGQALFIDVLLSGQLFLLLPVCFDKDCKNSSILLHDDNKWIKLPIDFEDKDHNIWGFLPPNNKLLTDTITMRSGDYNMDGYPDLLVTLQQKISGEIQTFLLQNTKCKGCSFGRHYEVLWETFKMSSLLSVFYDFYQDGVLDFIAVHKNDTTNKYCVSAYKNNLDYDANFFKVMVLTGLTNDIVPQKMEPWGLKTLPYGTNLPGPRISYQMVSPKGENRAGVCTQLPQSAYYALNLPYSTFGLDRTPNFIDILKIGLHNKTRTWTQLIPNSQIVVIPRPPSDPANWKVQLFVTPGKNILKSAGVVTGILGISIIIAIFLHFKEKYDDRLENNQIVNVAIPA